MFLCALGCVLSKMSQARQKNVFVHPLRVVDISQNDFENTTLSWNRAARTKCGAEVTRKQTLMFLAVR